MNLSAVLLKKTAAKEITVLHDGENGSIMPKQPCGPSGVETRKSRIDYYYYAVMRSSVLSHRQPANANVYYCTTMTDMNFQPLMLYSRCFSCSQRLSREKQTNKQTNKKQTKRVPIKQEGVQTERQAKEPSGRNFDIFHGPHPLPCQFSFCAGVQFSRDSIPRV